MAEHEEQARSEAQAIESYACNCSFMTEDAKEIRTHVMLMGKQDGKGTHKSLGRINKQTGETVLPPWNKRTKEQKRQSTHGKHVRKAHTWHEHDGHGCFTENNGRTRDILGE